VGLGARHLFGPRALFRDDEDPPAQRGNQIIAGAGEILGLGAIAETMAHAGIAGLLHKVITLEVAPHVAAVPECTALHYLDLIAGRTSGKSRAAPLAGHAPVLR
jgi:hypothetical protein